MKVRSLVLLLVVLLATVSIASAANLKDLVNVKYVEINGDKYYPGDDINAGTFTLGEPIDIAVKLQANDVDLKDLQVEAYLSGYKYSVFEPSLVSQVSKTFDLDAGDTIKLPFTLQVPLNMDIWGDNKDDVKLRIRVSDRNDISFEEVYQLNINGVDDSEAVQIKDFSVSPSAVVEQGKPLDFKVKVKNYGQDDLDDVTLRVIIPDLGVSDVETISELDSDETATFDDALLRIPKCAAPGDYKVVAVVEFNEYYKTTAEMNIKVVKGEACETNAPAATNKPQTFITIPQSQEVKKGTSGAVYPIMINNMGSEDKTYSIDVAGVDSWGSVRLDPGAVVVVPANSAKTAYLYLAAKDDAAPGEKVFKVTISGDGESKQVALTANVTDDKAGSEASYSGLRRTLEVGLIILVIVLIILGLIIGFNKLRPGRDSDEDDTQTYY